VIDPVTGKPVQRAPVVISGHDSGLGPIYRGVTDSLGRYEIPHVYVGPYPQVAVVKPGWEFKVRPVRVKHDGTSRNFRVRRDWASSLPRRGNGAIVSSTGVDFTFFGCGPNFAIDQTPGNGWSTTTGDNSQAPTNTPIPKNFVVKLPRAIDITSFKVDPTANCFDDPSSSTADYRIQVSASATGPWVTVADGTFARDDLFRYNAVSPSAPANKVSFVRFWIDSPQVPNITSNCPAGGFSGCQFMDMRELEVFGTPAP
jgi:hypothetical protein